MSRVGSHVGGVVEEARSLEPETSALLASVVGYTVFVRVAVGYASEYLFVLGGGPFITGIFGAFVAATRLGYDHFAADAGAPSTAFDTTAALALASSFGLLLWLVAPGLDGGIVPAWAWVILGGALVQTWPTIGIDTGLDAARSRLTDRDRLATVATAHGSRELAALVPLALAVGVFAFVNEFKPGFLVLLTLGVTTGLALVVVTLSKESEETHIEGTRLVPGPEMVDDLREMPRQVRSALFADMLVSATVTVTVTFVAVLVIEVIQPAVGVVLPLGPAALFAFLLAAEAISSAVAPLVGRMLLHGFAPRTVLTIGLAAATAVPMALVQLPPTMGVLLVLFTLFGVRTIARPARTALLDDRLDDRAARSYEQLRVGAAIPGAFVGGILYAITPTLAFDLATFAGMLGIWELFRSQKTRFVRFFAWAFDR